MLEELTMNILFVMRWCDVDPSLIPENGFVAVPANPPGSWYIGCANDATKEALTQRLNATTMQPMTGNFPACSFVTKPKSRIQPLKEALAAANINAKFIDEPEWIK